MKKRLTANEAVLKKYLSKGITTIYWTTIIAFVSFLWVGIVVALLSGGKGKDYGLLLLVSFAIAVIAAMGLIALGTIIALLGDIKIELHKQNEKT